MAGQGVVPQALQTTPFEYFTCAKNIYREGFGTGKTSTKASISASSHGGMEIIKIHRVTRGHSLRGFGQRKRESRAECAAAAQFAVHEVQSSRSTSEPWMS